MLSYTVTLVSGTIVPIIEKAHDSYSSLASTQIIISVDSLTAGLIVTVGSASGTITAGSRHHLLTLTTIGGQTTRRAGYAMSPTKCKLVGEVSAGGRQSVASRASS